MITREAVNRKLAQDAANRQLKNFVVKALDSVRREISVLNKWQPPQILPSLDAEGIFRDPSNPKRFFMYMKIKANLGPAFSVDIGQPVPIKTTSQSFVPIFMAPIISYSWEKDMEEIELAEFDIVEDIKEALIERVGDFKDIVFFTTIQKIIKNYGSVAAVGTAQARYFDAQYFKTINGGTDVVIEAWERPNDDKTSAPYKIGTKTLLNTMKNKAASLRVGASTWLIPEQAFNMLAKWDFADAGTLAPIFFVTGSIAAATNSPTIMGYNYITTTKIIDLKEGILGEIPGPINVNVLGGGSPADIDSTSSDTTIRPNISYMYLLPDSDFFGLHAEVQPMIHEEVHSQKQKLDYRLIYKQYWFAGIGISRAYFMAPIKIDI